MPDRKGQQARLEQSDALIEEAADQMFNAQQARDARADTLENAVRRHPPIESGGLLDRLREAAHAMRSPNKRRPQPSTNFVEAAIFGERERRR